VAIWYISSRFGIFNKEKSGNPAYISEKSWESLIWDLEMSASRWPRNIREKKNMFAM
jgi:hypothetical protein